MGVSILTLSIFIYLCISNGGSAALVAESLKYFSPATAIGVRFFSGFFFCLIILIILILFSKEYRKNIFFHFFPSRTQFFHISLMVYYIKESHIFL